MGEIELDLFDMYLIKWRDHYTTEGWTDLHEPEIHLELVFQSVGFFIKSEGHYWHFAQTVGESQCDNILSVIKENILEITKL